MLPIRSLDLVDSNITQTLTGWTYFLHFPVTGRVARAFSGVFYIGSNEPKFVFLLPLYNVKGNAYMMQIYYFIFNVCLEDFSNTILMIMNFVLQSQFLHMKNLL